MASRTPARIDSLRTTARLCWRGAASGHVVALAACGVLALVERVGGVAAVLAWRTPSFVYWIAVLSLVAVAHRLLRGYLRRTAMATAFRRVVEAVSDDGREIALGKGGSLAVVDAVDSLARTIADVSAPFVADIVATVVALAALVRAGAFPLLAGLAVAFAIFVAAMSLLAGRREPSFEKYLAVAERVADALDGRAELLASGATAAFMHDTEAEIEEWRRAAAASTFGALKAMRWSIVVVVVGGLFVVVSRGVDWILLKQALLVAVLAPLSLGTVQSAFALSRLASEIAPLGALFSDPVHRLPRGSLVPETSSIEWDGVTVSLGGRPVLSDVSASAVGGRLIALGGPNGAGKTTLLLATLGLRPLSAGRVRVGGVDLAQCDPRGWRARVRYLPQKPYLLPRRTVRDALQFPGGALPVEAMETALERVGLWERLQAKNSDPLAVTTDSLSAGERQRLALSRLLTARGDLYLLDEPDANLDAEGTRALERILRELADAGALVMFAAHSPDMLATADDVIRLVNGRLVRPALPSADAAGT